MSSLISDVWGRANPAEALSARTEGGFEPGFGQDQKILCRRPYIVAPPVFAENLCKAMHVNARLRAPSLVPCDPCPPDRDRS
jgi:hypothetical protein